MLGCLRSIGCLVVLAVLAAGAYLYRDRWLHYVHRPPATAEAPTTSNGATWEPISDPGAERAREAVAKLGQRSGPVFTNLRPGELASYIFSELSKQLPPSAENVEAAVIGDRVYVRATVNLKDLKGAGALGPFAAMLGEREPMQIGGKLDIVRPGLAEFVVEDLKLRDFPIPKPMIPRLIASLSRGKRPAGVGANALPLAVPKYIADVRATRGHITLYKNTQ